MNKRKKVIMKGKVMDTDQKIFEENHLNVVGHIDDFEETLWFKRLSEKEKTNARPTIILFSEYMFDYHFQTIVEWDSTSLKDVILNRFPYEVITSIDYFNQVLPIMIHFFDYLYYQKNYTQGLYLSHSINQLTGELVREVLNQQEDTFVSNLLSLGEEMNLDLSLLPDTEKLFHFVEEFEYISQCRFRITQPSSIIISS